MGTVFSFDVRGGGPEALDAAVAELHRLDALFSTYRENSQLSRLARGELDLADCDPVVAEVLELAAEAERLSDGWFSPRYAGRLDPTGIVKGWATERVAHLLRDAGATAVNVNGGGDVQLLGSPGGQQPWQVGVADPLRPGELAAVISSAQATELAVATSGTAERGAHIMDPRTGSPATTDLLSVTVAGPSLTWADCWATAAFAMGSKRARRWLESLPDVEAILMTDAPRGAGNCARTTDDPHPATATKNPLSARSEPTAANDRPAPAHP
ncbi:FAD:protein FMN transferase [Streptomyces sp. SAI-170]|uniref:FAD:protein FMN transferase n=1 Tax=Streptomyces sp. SAI-170 TaxID=3377729 RepID=UPI003C79FCB9